MYPRKFEYVAPGSVEEAVAALAAAEDAKVMAGGMSLLPLMKTRLLSPATIVDIGRIPGLDRIEDRGDHIALGALVRHAETATSPLVREHAPALARAAALTGDPQVRNRGTTCGSLAHADLAADQPAAVIACGATMVARGPSGTREIPADEFFVDTLTSALDPGEILVEVRIPKRGGHSAYDKLGRRGGHSDYAVAGAAAWVYRPDGTIEDARVALTGVGTRPTALPAVVTALVGTDGSAEAISAAAEHAVDEVTVLEDLYGSEEYKIHLAKVFVARAVGAALGG
jgi:Aerobic-type carbon monoxide dehydrogenase, middle subunit CoxM/CutM homologs